MKILIVYYSRTGTTKKIAEELSKNFNADLEEIVDKKNRAGAIGWVMSGRDNIKKALTEIEEVKNDPSQYDLVIFGSPNWVGTIAPAIV